MDWSFIGFKVGKSTIAIELEFAIIMTEEEMYCNALAIGRSPDLDLRLLSIRRGSDVVLLPCRT